MDKLKSRKFLLVVLWNLFVILGFVAIMMDREVSFMGNLITFAGTITTAYVGIQGYLDKK